MSAASLSRPAGDATVEFVSIGINASNRVPLADLDELDKVVPGLYEIQLPSTVPLESRADVALDVFHSKVAVDDLESFSFTPFNFDTWLVLDLLRDYEGYSYPGTATLLKREDRALPVFEVSLIAVGAETREALATALVVSEGERWAERLAQTQVLNALWPDRLNGGVFSPEFLTKRIEEPGPTGEATVLITLEATFNVGGLEPDMLRTIIQRNLERSVGTGLLEAGEAVVAEHSFEVTLADSAPDTVRDVAPVDTVLISPSDAAFPFGEGMASPMNAPPLPDMKETYWLYYGGNPIYAVRMDPGASTQDVQLKALSQHDAVPMCYPTPPATFGAMLMFSDVRQFERPAPPVDGQPVRVGEALQHASFGEVEVRFDQVKGWHYLRMGEAGYDVDFHNLSRPAAPAERPRQR
jgi:hypothetical protein